MERNGLTPRGIIKFILAAQSTGSFPGLVKEEIEEWSKVTKNLILFDY